MLTPIYERELIAAGRAQRVIGVDEVGRGSWAGPAAVGYYVFTLDSPPQDGINDSKKLSLEQREKVYSSLSTHEWGVKFVDVELIDKVGIHIAIEQLMQEVVKIFDTASAHILVDGRFTTNFGENVETVIGGDGIHYAIAAASILAKVERDRLMDELDIQYPGYGLAQHKGYGTKWHREALERLGPSAIHRHSYLPIKELYEKSTASNLLNHLSG